MARGSTGKTSMRWIARVVLAVAALLLAAFAWLGIPATGAGLVAKNVCSGVFVAGRSADDVLAADVLPASAMLAWVDVRVEDDRKRVMGRMLWSRERSAQLVPGLGCVLDASPELLQAAAPFSRKPGVDPAPAADVGPAADAAPAALPGPSAAFELTDWSGIDRAALLSAVDGSFDALGDKNGSGTRAVVVLHRGRLVTERYAGGFDPHTPQLGWSMSKTVLGLLVYAKLHEQGQAPTTRVLDWVQPPRRPAWLERWTGDERAAMTVEDLLLMRDGLDHQEGYAPWSAVPRMLWGAQDVPAYAGSAAAETTPGTRFRYLSATSNILSALLRAQFEDDQSYWRYPYAALFEPIGARSAVMEADARGNFIASSYLWATPRDWARIGEIMRLDGRSGDGMAGGRRILPAGWLQFAAHPPPIDDPLASGYGAHVWLAGAPRGSTCGPDHGLPADTLMMAGHWGQLVAAIPSREAVIVRLGMTLDRTRFSRCAFIRSILAALPETTRPQGRDAPDPPPAGNGR